MDMSQYLGVFIEETKEHLQSLNENLLLLETSPDNMEILNEIFRMAHTLKGMSGTMGFSRMQKLTHDMENVLSEIRNGKVHVNPDIVDILFKCLDALEKYTEEIVNTGVDGVEDNQDIIDSLNAIINGGSVPKTNTTVEVQAKKPDEQIQGGAISLTYFENSAVAKAIQSGFNVFSIEVFLNKSCVLKSARAFIIFRKLEECNCEIIKAEPKVEDIEDEKFDFSFKVILITNSPMDLISSELNSVAEVEKVDIHEISSTDIIVTDEEGNAGPSKSENTEAVNDNQVAESEQNKSPQNSDEHKNKPKAGKTVRVDIDRLDTLMNLVSELIIVKTRLEGVEDRDQNYQDAVEYLERVTTSLHDAVMKVRMVPVEQVFNRFPRTIRDLSRNLNKEIELHISGEDTELDRIVIDEIGDPLLHLLRNAGDHGLETPEERVKVGKPKKGNVYLRAYQDGNNVVIEVEDDGKGIDIEKVRKKAVERGNYTAEVAAKLTDKEVVDLLFMPSFSTAETITDVSGRGVGLDVVKSKITALGGIIETKTVLGKGSRFIVRLPMTLTIIQALMVKIGTEKYAIPLNTIQTIEDVKKTDIQYVQNRDVILLRDNVIPIVNLAEILDVPKVENNNDSFIVVIVKKGDNLAGFIVDTLIAQQEIVIRSLGKYLSGIKNITGATILGNGEVALILDTNTLV
jgi:two-component system chemotaxis sensor kinase CheA